MSTLATVRVTLSRSSWNLLSEILTVSAIAGDSAPFTLWAMQDVADSIMHDDDTPSVRVVHEESVDGLRRTLEWLQDLAPVADEIDRYALGLVRTLHLEIWHACAVASPSEGFWRMAPRIQTPSWR